MAKPSIDEWTKLGEDGWRYDPVGFIADVRKAMEKVGITMTSEGRSILAQLEAMAEAEAERRATCDKPRYRR